MAYKVVKIQEFIGHSQAVYSVCKGENELEFYSGSGDGTIRKWKKNSEIPEIICSNPKGIYKINYYNNYVFAGNSGGILSVFDMNNKNVIEKQISGKPVFDIAFSNDKILLASGDGNLSILNYDFSIFSIIPFSTKSLRCISVFDDYIAIAGSDGIINVIDNNFNLLFKIDNNEQSIFALAFDQISGTLVSGGRNAIIKKYKGKIDVMNIKAHLLHIHSLQYNPAFTFLLSCSMDKTIKIWDASSLALLKVLDSKYSAHNSSVNSAAWLNDKEFVTCSDDRKLILWKLEEERIL